MLEPCPFCGESENLLTEHMQGTDLHPAYRIVCDRCGASSRFTDRGWVEAWNYRHHCGNPKCRDLLGAEGGLHA